MDVPAPVLLLPLGREGLGFVCFQSCKAELVVERLVFIFLMAVLRSVQGSVPPPNPTELGMMLISLCFLWGIPCTVCGGLCHHLQGSMEHWLRGEVQSTGGTHQLVEGVYRWGGLWSSWDAEIHVPVTVSLCPFSLLLAVPRLFSHASALSILDRVRKIWLSWSETHWSGEAAGHFTHPLSMGKTVSWGSLLAPNCATCGEAQCR